MPPQLPWPFAEWQSYWLDAAQRGILVLDALRERGDTQIERAAKLAPHVLSFEAELLVDGRTLKRPVNYALARMVPPPGIRTDESKRPFIIFDPRAGHGPGIGGMKQESEIGVALQAGHPCYFVGFLPDAMPGQTIEDVCRAEAHFVEVVIARHPKADGRPCLIGNCQAGWQIMMMCAIRPDLPGPILLAGSPLSYWAGVRGKNPMRYTGGMLGGSWLAALTGDLGNDTFDGAHLVANFERLDPSNTYWKKLYNLYSKIDTEAPRFLDFESWWGNPVTLNSKEMQFIVDELFVGNKLAAGGIVTSDGTRVDLRNITSPIIVFCSWGDDITPPQQALGWLLDLYDTDEDMLTAGQTVVYSVHQSIGHLGIFVSGKVASKEHGEFTSCMDMIDMLPPGLFEAVITEVAEDTENPELIQGRYLFRLEPRKLDHIRELGCNSPEDERRFQTVARVSKINHSLYQACTAPAVRAMANDHSAELLRRTHPNRMRFEMFSSRNPLMAAVSAMAEQVRENRQPVPDDNPLLALERQFSEGMVALLDAYRDARDTMTEAAFMATYGSPMLQALVGLAAPEASEKPRQATRDVLRQATAARVKAQLQQKIEQGTPQEAALRALIYVLRGERRFDERAAAALERMREAQPAATRIGRDRFRDEVRQQSLILHLDEERAISALPRLLAGNEATRGAGLDAIRHVLGAQGRLSAEGQARLDRVAAMFQAARPQQAPEKPRGHASGGTPDIRPRAAAARHGAPTRARR